MQSLRHRLPPCLPLLGVILTISGPQAHAGTYNPLLESRTVNITGQPAAATLIKGQLPGPLLRFKEHEIVTIDAQAERPLVGEDIERKMGPALPQLCALGQAICVLVAPETTYKANWQLYQNGRPVEVLCVENSTKSAAYVISRPQSKRPPEIKLEEGLKFCSPIVS